MERQGRYTFLGDLGVGGMGSVRLGRAACGRLVVLKRALHEDGDLDQRLIDEARIGFRLQHANIVETLDLYYEEKRPVLVVAFVSGASLFELRRRRAFSLPVLARVGRQMAEALHAIHSATDEYEKPLSVVHRDVTPANIMVGHDGDARLIDLGIARSTETNANRTQTGFLRGTLRYLAPELFGDAVHSPATDLWSLGLCMLEAALGRRAILGGDAEAVGKIVAWSGIRLQPDERLDPRLHNILHMLLQRDPQKRVGSAKLASEMFARLEEQFAATKTSAAAFVTDICGPARATDAPDDSTELLMREAASTFCGPLSIYADAGDASGSNAHHAKTAGARSLAALYEDTRSGQASRAIVATPSRAPANDDKSSKTIVLDDADFDIQAEAVVGRLDPAASGKRDEMPAVEGIGTADVFLAQWPNQDVVSRAARLTPTARTPSVQNPAAPADAVLFAEQQMLTPSRPVPVAASGEPLPQNSNRQRAAARANGFPDPPPTPADQLRDYVQSLRGLEALDDDAWNRE